VEATPGILPATRLRVKSLVSPAALSASAQTTNSIVLSRSHPRNHRSIEKHPLALRQTYIALKKELRSVTVGTDIIDPTIFYLLIKISI
jgi:hypothetical protein